MAMPSITMPTSAAILVLLLMTSALAFPTRGGDTAGLAAQGAGSGAVVLDFWVPVWPVEQHLAAAAGAVAAGSPSGLSSDASPPPYQVCRQCRCCQGGDPTKCAMMPCCFTVTCNLPGRPFGQCSFGPRVCSCNNCT